MSGHNFETFKSFAETNRISLISLTALTSFIFLTRKFYFAGGSYNDKKTKLNGKCAIITGSNTGIGKEAAFDLARRGARVILACRDLERANKAAEEIRAKSGNGNVVVELLDLASFDSIRKFSAKINAQEERIDLLINNAGIMMCPKWTTKDGFEMQFGTNHLGHFLLTNLLLDKIKSSPQSRIVNVSSLAYKRGKMNWSDLNWEKSYDPNKAYGQSKLANILFTRELAKKLEGTKVTVNALHPGVVRTELTRYLSDTFGFSAVLLKYMFFPLIAWFFKTVPEGTQTTLYCALSSDLNNVSGFYFSDCKLSQLLPHALDDQDAKKLWEISEELCKLK